jgi:effector-binding domain-containing protein
MKPKKIVRKPRAETVQTIFAIHKGRIEHLEQMYKRLVLINTALVAIVLVLLITHR